MHDIYRSTGPGPFGPLKSRLQINPCHGKHCIGTRFNFENYNTGNAAMPSRRSKVSRLRFISCLYVCLGLDSLCKQKAIRCYSDCVCAKFAKGDFYRDSYELLKSLYFKQNHVALSDSSKAKRPSIKSAWFVTSIASPMRFFVLSTRLWQTSENTYNVTTPRTLEMSEFTLK